MSESQHPDTIWNDPRITAYALGELTPQERQQFEAEMAASQALAAAVSETSALTNQLKSHFASETTPPLDAQRRSAILSQSAGSSPSPAKQTSTDRRPWWMRRWVELAVAASLVFIVIALSMPARNAMRVAATKTNSPAGQTVIEDDAQPAIEILAEPAEESLRYQQLPMTSSDDSIADPFAATDGAAMDAATDPASVPFAAKQNESIAGAPERERGLMRSKAVAKPQSEAAPAVDSLSIAAEKPMPDMPAPAAAAAEFSAMPAAPAPVQTPSRRGRMSMEEQMRTEGGYSMGGVAGDMYGGGAVPADDATRPIGAMYDMGGGIAGAENMGMGMDGFGMGPMQPDHPFGEAIDEGRGPGIAGDRFDVITDNAFQRVSEHPLSTFSIDVDTASYSKVRMFLNQSGTLPRPDAVRIEEMINYFDYSYQPPAADSEHPLVARAEVVSCPWNESHRLARIAIKGKTLTSDQRPACNLVFLIDSSGSMNAANKLPLVQEGMKLLLSKLGPKDRVAIVVYAGSAGLVLESTAASDGAKIRRALTQLSAGGSTNGGAGITLAYQTARDHFIKDGVNRVILCTDGDFNVGTTGTDSLVRMVEDESKGGVFLTVLGFGMGNHNDSMLEQISGKGNGTYAYIDTINEARKVLVDQTDSTLVTIAKDVKLQLEFNPARVSSYRLIGYENRVLVKEDFNDDLKDAGEIGAGHTVTALYEIVPVGTEVDAIAPPVDELRYQTKVTLTEAADSNEVLTVKMRYKAPDGDTSKLVEFPVSDTGKSFEEADVDVRFAAAVAGFGMKLRSSPYAGKWSYSDVEKTAEAALGDDRFGLRAEFLELVRQAAMLTAEER
jgi:Ca-activated chloride channel family protein